MSDTIRIFDTTLRDGEQSPGATLDTRAKVVIARQLARLGVDVIEAGFPAASPGDLDAVARIAREIGSASDAPIIAGLARAIPRDIDACWQAVRHAEQPRIHTFIATSDIHLEYKLKMTCAEVLDTTAAMVRYAKSLCHDVEFSAEDASRSDPDYLCEVFGAAIAAGATTINIPDTVGYAQPEEFGALVAHVIAHTPGIADCIVSVHCHDDLGLAVANTMAGLNAGARQAECTINGIGERAGNAALEEIVMALHTRAPYYEYSSRVNTTQLSRTSHLVATRTGINVPPNKAVVGANAFAHEAGIHQDGVIKHAGTYEIMQPATVGLSTNRLVLGKHSGRHALRQRLEELGTDGLQEDQLARIFSRFKQLADVRKSVSDAELEALIDDEVNQSCETFVLQGVHVSCGAPSIPTASVSIADADGEHQTRAATGNGPVDAIFSAINQVVRCEVELCEYVVHAVSGGVDALGQVTVRVRPAGDKGRMFSGHGADTDILFASAKAYMSAINRMLDHEARRAATGPEASSIPLEPVGAQS
jgi:2-isopropylmalate synthase